MAKQGSEHLGLTLTLRQNPRVVYCTTRLVMHEHLALPARISQCGQPLQTADTPGTDRLAGIPGIEFLRLGRNKGRSETVPQRCSTPCTRAVAVPPPPPSFQPYHQRVAFAKALAPFRSDQELPDLRGVEPCTGTCLALPLAPAKYFGPIPTEIHQRGAERQKGREHVNTTGFRHVPDSEQIQGSERHTSEEPPPHRRRPHIFTSYLHTIAYIAPSWQ